MIAKIISSLFSLPWISLDIIQSKCWFTVLKILIISISTAVVCPFLEIKFWSSSKTLWTSWNSAQYDSISHFVNQVIFVSWHWLHVLSQHVFQLLVWFLLHTFFFFHKFLVLVRRVSFWTWWFSGFFWRLWSFGCCQWSGMWSGTFR